VIHKYLKTIVHVNQHVIKSNRKNDKTDPVLTVKTSKSNTYAHTVKIDGPTQIVYRPDNPLSCGAHVWIETFSKVEADGKVINRRSNKKEFYENEKVA